MNEPAEALENLFSYGTLQLASVQQATFGRALGGSRDALAGYALSTLAIADADVVATSGEASHPIIRASGAASDVVQGMVFKVTMSELERADAYEVDAYRRVGVVLVSGARAWVYVAADSL